MKQIENRITQRINEEADLKSRLADSEREKDELRIQRDEMKAALQEACRRTDGTNPKSNLEIIW